MGNHRIIETGIALSLILGGPAGCATPPRVVTPVMDSQGLSQNQADDSLRAPAVSTRVIDLHPRINSILRIAEVPDSLYTQMGVKSDDRNKDFTLYQRLWTSDIFAEPLQKLGAQFDRGTFDTIDLHFRTNSSTNGYSFWITTSNNRILTYAGYDDTGENGYFIAAPRGAKIASYANGDIPANMVKNGLFTPIPDIEGIPIDPQTGILMLSDKPTELNQAFINDLLNHKKALIGIVKEQISLNRLRQPLSFTLFATLRTGKKSIELRVVDGYDKGYNIPLAW